MEDKFYSPAGQDLYLFSIIKETVAYVKAEPEFRYKIIIGTDSKNNEITDFVSAIVVYRVGHGGRFLAKN